MSRRPSASGHIDRLPPHSPEAEQGVLGSVFYDPSAVMGRLTMENKPGKLAFYDLRHQEIYAAMEEMYGAREQIDTITLQQHLKDKQMLEQVGGLAYLSVLPDEAPGTGGIDCYLPILLEKFVLRQMIAVCAETVASIYGDESNVLAKVDEFERQAMSVRRQVEGDGDLVNVHKTIHELFDDYDAAVNGKKPMGVATGFSDVDDLCGGMMPQELIVLAGLRSSGKTTLAVNIMLNCAKAGVGAGLISLETSGKKIIHRLGCRESHTDGSMWLRGKPTEGDFPKMMVAMDRITKAEKNLFISEQGNMTPQRLAARARRMYQLGMRVLVVDYLQLLDCPGKSEYERITTASKTVKGIAKELNIPVIAIASLNRESDKDNRAPKLSDLRSSGQIEYDADKAWLLHCKDTSKDIRSITLSVAKNKDGPCGDVYLTLFASQFRMEPGMKGME